MHIFRSFPTQVRPLMRGVLLIVVQYALLEINVSSRRPFVCVSWGVILAVRSAAPSGLPGRAPLSPAHAVPARVSLSPRSYPLDHHVSRCQDVLLAAAGWGLSTPLAPVRVRVPVRPFPPPPPVAPLASVTVFQLFSILSSPSPFLLSPSQPFAAPRSASHPALADVGRHLASWVPVVG